MALVRQSSWKTMFLLGCIFFMSPFSLWSQFYISPSFVPSVGKVQIYSGKLNVTHFSGNQQPLESGQIIYLGDRIVSSEPSHIQISFYDEGVISLASDIDFEIVEFQFDANNPVSGRAHFYLNQGVFFIYAGKIGEAAPEHYSMATPNCFIGVLGTTFEGVTHNYIENGALPPLTTLIALPEADSKGGSKVSSIKIIVEGMPQGENNPLTLRSDASVNAISINGGVGNQKIDRFNLVESVFEKAVSR